MTASAATPAPATVPAIAPAHRLHEDVQAIATGTLFVALGLVLFNHAGLLTGGTAGLALVLHYVFGWSFPALLFTVNLPFYVLAWLRLGWRFTLKTFLAVTLLSVLAHWLPLALVIQHLHPVLGAVLGGLLCGAGMLMLFRHRASLGGFNVLVLFLQERLGWRAGHVQLALDTAIVIGAGLAVADLQRVLLSILAAVSMNLLLAVNHRPGRYLGV